MIFSKYLQKPESKLSKGMKKICDSHSIPTTMHVKELGDQSRVRYIKLLN